MSGKWLKQRINFKFLVKLEKNTTDIYKILTASLLRGIIIVWVKRFEGRKEDITDAEIYWAVGQLIEII